MKNRHLNPLILAAGLLLSANTFAAGALAIDANQGEQYGFAYNYPDMGQAEQRALSECGNQCAVVLQFETGCGAYAADQQNGSSIYGWGTDANGGNAQSRAISECQSRGGTSCMVRVWGCNGN